MFRRVIKSPIYFFDLNPIGIKIDGGLLLFCLLLIIGRIMNRFTKDVNIMDDFLPTTVFDFLQVSLKKRYFIRIR